MTAMRSITRTGHLLLGGCVVAVACLALAGNALSSTTATSGATSQPLQFQPCPTNEFSGLPGGQIFPDGLRVDCGTLAVPENRSNPRSRTIRFGFAIVHAASGHPRSDPIVFMNGGPSIGSIQEFAFLGFPPFRVPGYFENASYAQDRDVILIDTRGEGVSTPHLADPRLGCTELDVADYDSFWAKPFIGSGALRRADDALRTCKARFAGQGVDLSAYNSAETAADLEALRRALGIRQWNLWVASADGIAGLTYMRLYPAGIRSAVLDSPQSPSMNGELDNTRGQAALFDHVFAGCAANSACAAAYPHVGDRFYELMDRLQAHPVNVTVRFADGRSIVVNVDGIEFWAELRDSLFQGKPMAMLTRAWDATHGRLTEVVRDGFGDDGPTLDDSIDNYSAKAKTESYVCHDVVNLVPRSEYTRAAAELPRLAPLILGQEYANPVGQDGCSVWNNGVADPAQHRPVRSTIPTLITTGEFDLGVSPNIVRQIPLGLPNSFFYEFPAAFHTQIGTYSEVSGCAQAIAGQFLQSPTQRPDATCIDDLPRFDYTP